MSYLFKNIKLRNNTAHTKILQNASAVVVAALSIGSGRESEGLWRYVAKYARGRDYHKTMKKKLRRLADTIRAVYPSVVYRIFVDSAPLMERTLALMAGLGSLGKNGSILIENVGPSVLLGEIVCANVPVPTSSPLPMAFERCDECTVCMDSCPTGAIIEPAIVDASKCLSYWSIEEKEAPPKAVSRHFKQIFGCDICTTVCPLSNSAESALETATSPHHLPLTLRDFLQTDDNIIEKMLHGTALRRAGPEKLKQTAQFIIANKRIEQ